MGFLQWLQNVASNMYGYVYLDNATRYTHEFVAESFEEHKKTYVKCVTGDLIDADSEQMNYTNENEGNDESSLLGKQGCTDCVRSDVGLFVAGGDTVASTLKWAAMYLSHDLEVQRRFQNKVDDVVGRERMPYTEAEILETLRLSSLLMFRSPRELIEGFSFHGYTLPRRAILIAKRYHINHDTMTLVDPENFRPELFLMDEGLKDCLVPFHAGRRRCLGPELAKDILFMVVVKMIQQFSYKPGSGASNKEDFEPA